jgi:ankyrin repeat protein
MPSLFFQSGQTSQRSSHPLSKSYELTGEGLREAVKNGDVAAVKDLLSQGLDANYFDKQGMSLLHLAAMFNFTEITFMLMDAGANVQAKNAQGMEGETVYT